MVEEFPSPNRAGWGIAEARSLIEVFLETTALLWPCYTDRMEIVNFPESNYGQIGARGKCPHCSHVSYFRPVTGGYSEHVGEDERVCIGAQCESCKEYILVVGRRTPRTGIREFKLEAVYPLGKPNDSVDPAVPAGIAEDFSEALRCQWVNAYRATVVMCRRAIQATALEKGAAPQEKLIDQIDELAGKGILTEPLKQMAHEIRLTGNEGAHPDEGGLNDVTGPDANDIIEFTREYFHHVYVMPAKLKARRKPKDST